MQITKEEAGQSLEEIYAITQRVRKSIAGTCASGLLILWGFIWLIGYGGSQFYPQQAGLLFGPLCLAGGIASWIIGVRSKGVRSPGSWRIGVFWVVLFAYAAVWAALLHPFNEAHIGAYMGTIPMFAYIVGGLWFDRFFVWLGAGVTVVILLGVFAFPAWSNLWIAAAGGGSLITSGLYIRKYWR